MHRTSLRFVWILAASFTAWGCTGSTPGGSGGDGSLDDALDGGADVAGGAACTTVVVEEDITVHTTWSEGHVYVIDTYGIHVNATLTIQPGAVIKFRPSAGPYLALGAGGTINAQGTAQKPIVWTSYKDDAHCGDTNGDGAATSPSATDWDDVDLNGEQGSVFTHNHFLYGGGGTYKATLVLSGDASAQISHCTFAHNLGGKEGDFYYGALSADSAPASTLIASNTFYDNALPLSVSTAFSVDDSNVFHDPSDPSHRNTMNGIFVDNTTQHIISAISWAETEVPFVIFDNDFWIDTDTGVLSLADNVVVKFTSDATLVYDGTNFNNHGGSRVVFTSFKDDSRAGDTNGDGSASSPLDGDWGGIFNDGLPEFGDYESWANIYYDDH